MKPVTTRVMMSEPLELTAGGAGPRMDRGVGRLKVWDGAGGEGWGGGTSAGLDRGGHCVQDGVGERRAESAGAMCGRSCGKVSHGRRRLQLDKLIRG